MPTCSIYESPKSIQIREISHQLLTQFHPAMKNVSISGHNLSRAQEGISKSFNSYTSALLALSHTGDKLHYSKSRYHAENLRKTAQTLQKIYTEQAKWIEHFSKLSVIIQENSDNEKERLKSLSSSYIRKEKNLMKALSKTQHTRFNMEEFYEEELNIAIEQQSQRYRFFAERNDDLIKRFLEWTKQIIKTIENDYIFLNYNQDEEEKKLLNGNVYFYEYNNMIKTINNQEENASDFCKQNAIKPIYLNNVEKKQNHSDLIKEFQQLYLQPTNSKKTTVSENDDKNLKKVAYYSYDKNNHYNDVVDDKNNVQQLKLPNENSKKEENSQLNENFYHKNEEKTEMEKNESSQELHYTLHNEEFSHEISLPLITLKHISQSYLMDSNYSKNNNSRNHSREPSVEKIQTPKMQIENQFTYKIPDQFIKFDSVKTNNNAIISDNTNNNSQHQIQENYKIPVIMINNDNNLNETQQAVTKTEPIFSVLDNGKILKCIISFEAHSENQLSLNVDECITLIKSGTRGWVLVKTLDGLRQGWFPAKFLRLVDS